MNPILRPLISATILLGMVICEYVRPKRKLESQRSQRWPINLGLALLNFLLLKLTSLDLAISGAQWAQVHNFGLFNMFAFNNIASIILTILVLDLVIYFQHRVFHLVPFFWHYHRVHHSDTDFDTTTAVRFHPIEIIISMFIKIFFILLIGADSLGVLIFEAILNGCALFNHSNFNIPQQVDRWLRMLIITPDVHRIHHSVEMKETNSNYGFSILWWDICFKTYTENPQKSHETMTLGLKEIRSFNDLTFIKLLQMPYEKFTLRKP